MRGSSANDKVWGSGWMRRRLLGGVLLAALAVTASVALAACGDKEEATEPAQGAQSTQQSSAPQETSPPAVENPLPVGQAMDAVAAPAIAEVLGEPVLTRAPEAEALIVSLVYQAPVAAVAGDGERLRDAFLEHGANLDPEHSGVEQHNEAEEFSLLLDTGDPAFQTLRVTVTPGSTDVYVNADKAQ